VANLIPVKDAQKLIVESIAVLGHEIVSLENASGRVLAVEIFSNNDLPPFTNSSVDGFAVRFEDVQNATSTKPSLISVIADIPAGTFPSITLKKRLAVRVMTGAPVPASSDCVIPIEATDYTESMFVGDFPVAINVFEAGKSGSNIRPKGQDIKQGALAIAKGTNINPQTVGLLATLGVVAVPVYRKPKIAVLSSGDELIDPSEELSPGKIRESNSFMLQAALRQTGAEIIQLPIAKDDPAIIKHILDQAVMAQADMIVTSAGVSVGAFDYVKKIIEDNGGLNFWRVNMRPGKPLAYGNYQGIPVIGLPGNPVSSFVAYHVFVVPAVRKMIGLDPYLRLIVPVKLGEMIESDGRETYLRATIHYDGKDWTGKLVGHQGSGNLTALVLANALLIVPSGVKSLPAGVVIQAWIFDRFI
jgi:molybdopterin molybdotransferase